ncbi:ECF transporter S component [Natrinema halophilum]|uniref:ECF transporter S component n=1 Tax=Natrinema halophilum TaxID=1699371 RepID=A0A7D5GII9_9EURY|nr:ECF transporter S component [Natrinema halophilum]QLG49828.1 hypothetical protein HYG82_13660 [Natrinema halophilum]
MGSTTTLDRVQSDFTTTAWVLIPVAVGLNLVGRFIVQTLRLPLFLDSSGTILLGIIAGPWVAAVGGGLTSIMIAIGLNPGSLPFIFVQIAFGIVSGTLAYRGWFVIETMIDYWKLITSGVILAIVSTLISTPIAVYLFGGVTGAPADVMTGVLLASGQDLFQAVLGGRIVIELIDKTAAIIVAYYVAVNIPKRYLPKRGREALGE